MINAVASVSECCQDLKTCQGDLKECNTLVVNCEEAKDVINANLSKLRIETAELRRDINQCELDLNQTREDLSICEEQINKQDWLGVVLYFIHEQIIYIYIISVGFTFVVGLEVCFRYKVTVRDLKRVYCWLQIKLGIKKKPLF